MNDYDRFTGFRRDWTPPAELSGSMREVRLTGAGKALLVIAVLVALGGIAAGLFLTRLASSQNRWWRTLDTQGVDVRGSIVRLWREPSGGNGDTRGMVAYEFPLQGRMMSGQSPADNPVWRSLSEGGPIDVRAVPADPAINHPVAWRENTLPQWFGLPVALGLFVPAGLLRSIVERQSGLLSAGRPVPAVVTRHIRDKGGQAFSYEFPVMGGAMQKGRGGPSRTPPAIGSTVCVLYDPDNPRRNAAYPMPLVRLAG
jgi:hypothetical protein